MIIVYRNRLEKRMRENLISMDERQYRTMGEIIREKIRFMKRKFPFVRSQTFAMMASFFSLAVGATLLARFNLTGSMLRADVGSAGDSATFGKVAFDSVMLGRISDPILASIQNF